MASKRRNMFHKNKTQETTEEGDEEDWVCSSHNGINPYCGHRLCRCGTEAVGAGQGRQGTGHTAPQSDQTPRLSVLAANEWCPGRGRATVLTPPPLSLCSHSRSGGEPQTFYQPILTRLLAVCGFGRGE
ncbi:hypothetical protein AAG570_009575 [Ranatra chinensis]|uniref:Uncharacterized protein n=1 Tax=Ranatra chinensis TaxID=642074 RepID=A0ABD0ZCS0_9HEMI